MALITKTIEYAWGAPSFPLAAATALTSSYTSIFIPETSSRVFKSVFLKSFVHDAASTAASLTALNINFRLGTGSAFVNPGTLGAPPANSGENQSFIFLRDLTSYFSQSFGNTTTEISGSIAMSFTGVATALQCHKLYITYTYDDTNVNTLIKTVRIPLVSNNKGALTAGMLERGGQGSIPVLNTFLPEQNKHIRQNWIEILGNEGTTAAGTLLYQLSASLDSEAPVIVAAPISTSLNSACADMFIWTRSFDTSTTHSFKMGLSNIASFTMPHPTSVLHVTYDYDRELTRQNGVQLNSVVIPLQPLNFSGFTRFQSASQTVTPFWIQEPGPITIQNTAAIYNYFQTANINPSFSINEVYSNGEFADATSLYCGSVFGMQRLDSASNGLISMSLNRGKNTFVWRGSIPTAGVTPGNFSCQMYINYLSGVPSGSPDFANKTIYWLIESSSTAGTAPLFIAKNRVNLDSTYYFINAYGIFNDAIVLNTAAAATPMMYFMLVQLFPGEKNMVSSSWSTEAESVGVSDGESGWYPNYSRSDLFERWAGDPSVPSQRISIKDSVRQYAGVSLINSNFNPYLVTTIHNITSSIAGTVSGYTGDGSGIPIRIYDYSGELLITGSTSVGGGYNIPWYDNTSPVFAYALQDTTHIGASITGSSV